MKEDMVNIEYAITISELKYPSICVIDTLINLYDVQFFGCRKCAFRDKSIKDDISCIVNVTDGKSVLK